MSKIGSFFWCCGNYCWLAIRHFEVARVIGLRWLSKCIVGMFWLTNLPPCWKFVPKTIPRCTGQPSRPGLSRNLRVANCVVAYSTAQKWVTSRVSFPVRRESRSAGIIDVAISGINYWRHVQCLFNLVYRYYFIWWLHPTPKSRSFPKSHFLSFFFCPLMATARNWNKSFMHIELCAGTVAIGRRGLVNQIPILTPDPGSWKAD